MTYDNIKVGDKVRYTGESKIDLTHGKVYEVVVYVSGYYFEVIDDVGDENCIVSYSYELVTDDTEHGTPTLWRDMTDAEKGALLLAHNEGKVIEALGADHTWRCIAQPAWDNAARYRIKPERKVETVTYLMHCDGIIPFIARDMSNPTHRITFDVIDGKPDCDSIKMKPLDD